MLEPKNDFVFFGLQHFFKNNENDFGSNFLKYSRILDQLEQGINNKILRAALENLKKYVLRNK